MEQTVKERLLALYEQWAGESVGAVSELPPSGSDRRYFRISSPNAKALGAINKDLRENMAFIEFSRFFKSRGLRVSEIYAVDADMDCYLLEDFGGTTLFELLSTRRKDKEIPEDIEALYRESIRQLLSFQTEGRELDFSHCYPRARFDKQSMMWDLHYFKYYFLKLARISFDEQLLEDDFNRFSDFLLKSDCTYFMYRDFQSRNIMVTDGGLAFIDYQGGRRGALQYDLASLLYDAKADLPQELREELLEHYLELLTPATGISRVQFMETYHGYVLIRIMQAMGAYGFRGFYEKKQHFLRSIPYALTNLKHLLSTCNEFKYFPMLYKVLCDLCENQALLEISAEQDLTVSISSFSFKRGIPVDNSGNGGGFVFDCRALSNPGRYAEYSTLTGKDPEVIDFLQKAPEVHSFLENIYSIVDQSVENYLGRGFKHLMVSFGCTGGRHRSVYCAERLAEHLRSKYRIRINLKHLEQDNH